MTVVNKKTEHDVSSNGDLTGLETVECLDDQDLLHTMDEGQYEATARKEWQRAQKSRFHNKGDARGQPNRSRTIHERSVHIAPRVRTMSLPHRQEGESPLEHPTRRQRRPLSPAPAVGLGEWVGLVEFQVVWEVERTRSQLGTHFRNLVPKTDNFLVIDMAKVQLVHQSQIRQEVRKDHLQGQRRTGEGKSTTSFPTKWRDWTACATP